MKVQACYLKCLVLYIIIITVSLWSRAEVGQNLEEGLTYCSDSQGRHKHPSGCPDTIGPHHQAKGEEEEAQQGAKVKQEVRALR